MENNPFIIKQLDTISLKYKIFPESNYSAKFSLTFVEGFQDS